MLPPSVMLVSPMPTILCPTPSPTPTPSPLVLLPTLLPDTLLSVESFPPLLLVPLPLLLLLLRRPSLTPKTILH